MKGPQYASSTLHDYPDYNPKASPVDPAEWRGPGRVSTNYDWLKSLGLTREVAAGIAGNLSQESALGRAFHEFGKKLGWGRGGIGDVAGDERLKYEKWMTAHNYKLDDQEGMHRYLLEWPGAGSLWNISRLTPAFQQELRRCIGPSTSNGQALWRANWGGQKNTGLDPEVIYLGHHTLEHKGHAKISIDLKGFSKGTKTAASATGVFKEVRLNRGRAYAVDT